MVLEDLLRMPPLDGLIYLEQNVNYLFQNGKRVSEVGSSFQPEMGAEYEMPYVLLPQRHPRLEYFEIQPTPLLKEFVVEERSVKFFLHPDMLEEYKALGFSELLDSAGEILVSPTASTRTVITRNLPFNFMVKVNLTKKIGFLSRKLTRTSVAQSNKIMAEMIQCENEMPTGFGFFLESIGVVFGESVGEIFREPLVRPPAEASVILYLFSLSFQKTVSVRKTLFYFARL